MYRKHTYLTPAPFVINSSIAEYDIEKANISILFKEGLISAEQYQYYYNADRMKRQIDVGLMIQKDSSIGKTIQNGVIEAKRLFFEANGLNEGNILSIKNDAIFVVNKVPQVIQFDTIKFNMKNKYTSYMIIDRIEYYYYLSTINNTEYLHIKGMSDTNVALHNDYLIDFIKHIFSLLQTSTIMECINTLQGFYNEYINLRLEPGYYRTFDRYSKFMIGPNKIYASSDAISSSDLKEINISCNRAILETLYSYLITLQFSNNK